MFFYLFELMRYMGENGIEDFRNNGINKEVIDNIVNALRLIVLNAEDTPIFPEPDPESEEMELDDYQETFLDVYPEDYEEYELDIPSGIKLKCSIWYLTPLRSRLMQPENVAKTRMRIFRGVRSIEAFDNLGNSVPIFDEQAFSKFLYRELNNVHKGEKVRKSQLNYYPYFSEGLVLAYYNQKTQIIEKKENPENNEHLNIVSNEIITKYAYVNRKGDYAFPGLWFDGASDFCNGVAKVKKDDRIYYIDLSGNEIKDPEVLQGVEGLNSLYMYGQNSSIWHLPDDFGTYYEIDSDEDDGPKGNIMFDWVEDEEGEYCIGIVSPDGNEYPLEKELQDKFKYYVEDFDGDQILLIADEPMLMINPNASAKPEGCCIDSKGKLRYKFDPLKRIPVYGYSEGYAIFHDFCWWYDPERDPYFYYDDDSEWPSDVYFKGFSYVDHEGNQAIRGMAFDDAFPFKDGIAMVVFGNRLLFIDREFRVVF